MEKPELSGHKEEIRGSFDLFHKGATAPVHDRDRVGPEGPKAEARFSLFSPERIPVFTPPT